MLLVQRFADLALSTLRLGFVGQQWDVTEPGKQVRGGGVKNKNNSRDKSQLPQMFSTSSWELFAMFVC